MSAGQMQLGETPSETQTAETAREAATRQWENVSAGPRQIADLQKAMRRLRAEGQTHTERTGVIGGDSHDFTLMSPMGPVRAEVIELDGRIRARYSHQITRGNVREITAAYVAALPEAARSRPVDDKRRTAEKDAELRARVEAREAAERAEREARGAMLAQVMAKAPAAAKALIVAEYHEDTSDPQTDYFSSRTARVVAIGWRFSAREDFRALRAAAASFPETAHMADAATLEAWQKEHNGRAWGELEHRDNYSMGAGNYLSDHGWSGSGTGWIVKSAALPCRYVHLTEDAIPEATATPATGDSAASADGLTVAPSSLGRDGVIELRFPGKPDEQTREALKRGARFRWSRYSGCWYGSRDAYERARAAGWQLPALPEADTDAEAAAMIEAGPTATEAAGHAGATA